MADVHDHRSSVLRLMGVMLVIVALAVVVAGTWLVGLGGSWYYLASGLGLLVAAVLLLRRSSLALWVYAALLACTLAWAVWEAGLDWWPLAARLDVWVVFGLLLLLPSVRRPLGARNPAGRRGGTNALAVALAACAAVSVVSWLNDPHDVKGALPAAAALSLAPEPLRGRDMWGATMFDQLACRIAFHRVRYEGRFTPPSTQGSLVHPGNFGVFNWGSITVDPRHGTAFITPAYLAFISKLVPRPDDQSLMVQEGGAQPPGSLPALNENFGAPYAAKTQPFRSPLGIPCQEPPWGYVAGVDLVTGKMAWKQRNGTVRDLTPVPLPFRMGVPNLGGPIVTAGEVAFLSSTMDYYVRAYDARDGRQLWRSRLPAGGQATPMTYTGANGRQYVVVVAGGHGSIETKPGDSVIAYALPKR